MTYYGKISREEEAQGIAINDENGWKLPDTYY